MDVELAVAGVLCVLLAAGHTIVGVRWVLPAITEERLPRTPFGPPALSLSMVRVTWFIVTVFALGLGGILLTLAWADAAPQTVVLRWFAGMWLAATALAVRVTSVRRSALRNILRMPVPLVWIAVAVLCWVASI
jgi:hypothetical protein